MPCDKSLKYYAFISYKHQHITNAPWAKTDHLWAKKIHKYLTSWKIPNGLDTSKLINTTDKKITPIFRDEYEIYAGENTTKILQENLEKSKAIIIICSTKMIADQIKKQKKREKAYIFNEIDYFKENCDGPIILVWIDKTPFDKNSPLCLPPQLKNADLKVIEANEYRRNYFNVKRHVTAEIAASIFQTNKSLFWDLHNRQRKRKFSIIGVIFLLISFLFITQNRERNINYAYRTLAEAKDLLVQGNRKEAIQKASLVYEAYSNTEGLTSLMRECLDDSNPYTTFQSPVCINEEANLYATILDHQKINIYDLSNDELLRSFDGFNISDIVFSSKGEKIAYFNPRLISVFDLNSSQQEPISTINLDYNTSRTVQFNASATLLLTETEESSSRKIYKIYTSEDTGNKDILNLNLDSIYWKRGGASFMGTDSILAIYGELIVSNTHLFTRSQLTKKESKWSCHIYDLRKNKVLLKCELTIPNNTTHIAASNSAPNIIVATTDETIVYTLGKYGFNTSRLKYRHKIGGYSEDNLAMYKEQNPTTWDKRHISDIRFSGNGQYALLTDSTNVQYSLCLVGYPRFAFPNNGLHLSDDVKESNNKELAIGITNKGDYINLNINELVNKNLTINGVAFHGIKKYHKPIHLFNLTYKVWGTHNTLFLTEERNIKDTWYSETGTKKYYKTYLYKKVINNHLVKSDFISRFSKGKDTLIVGISPSQKYAVLETYERNERKSSLIWDIKERKTKCSLSDIFYKNNDTLDYGYHYSFPSKNENIITLGYYTRTGGEEPGNRSSSWAIIDSEQEKIILEKAVYPKSYFVPNQNSESILLFTKQNDSTYFLNPQNGDIVLETNGKHALKTEKRKSSILPLQTHYENRNEEKYLFDYINNKIIEIPDTLDRCIDFASPDRKYLIANYKNTTTLLEQNTFKTIYTLPIEYKRSGFNGFVDFTQDSKYLMYTKTEESGITFFDLENNKEIYTIGQYTNIKPLTANSISCLDNGSHYGFAQSQKHIVFASHDIVIADIYTGKILKRFDLALNANPRMQFTPNGKYLIVENYLIDIQTMACIQDNLRENPTYITNEAIIYTNDIFNFLSKKQLYEKLKAECKKFETI